VQNGQAITISASWNKQNDYLWSNGDTVREITLTPTTSLVLSVSDKKGCITDSFFIQIGPNSLTDVQEVEQKVAPNPVRDKICISDLAQGNYVVSLIDCMGRLVLYKEIAIAANNSSIVIPVEAIANGIYTARIELNHKNLANRRIVIAH
jgi:cellulose biosynthesis protein BcsQ